MAGKRRGASGCKAGVVWMFEDSGKRDWREALLWGWGTWVGGCGVVAFCPVVLCAGDLWEFQRWMWVFEDSGMGGKMRAAGQCGQVTAGSSRDLWDWGAASEEVWDGVGWWMPLLLLFYF